MNSKKHLGHTARKLSLIHISLYHTATYFVMTPKVMNIIVKNERLPHHVLRNALWAVTAVISVIALILVYM